MPIQSVNRALDILFLFSDARPQLGITEISELVKLTKPTVHGLVRTLTDRGFLQQDTVTKKYSLGLSIYELGSFLAGSLKINQIAAEFAHQLAQETSHLTRIAIWDQNSILVTLNAVPGMNTDCLQQLGPRVPAYCSASGKAILSTFTTKALQRYFTHTEFIAYTPHTITDEKQLLSELKQIRDNGYALDREEFMPGVACLSAPVYDHSGLAVAAVSLSSIPDLLMGERIEAFAKAVRRTAMAISSRMGFIEDSHSDHSAV